MTTDHQHDLQDRLDRLADRVPAGPGADGAELYRRSLRRQRRRGVATVGAFALATALVVTGGAALLPQLDNDSAPSPSQVDVPLASGPEDAPGDAEARAAVLAGIDDPGRRTAGETVEVTKAEAEARCTAVWRQLWGPSDVTVRLAAASGPWFEGDAVLIANAGDFDYSPFDESGTDGRCVIPQAGLEGAAGTLPLPLPAATDVAGVRAACGQYLGWDFTDWSLVVADGSATRVAALLSGPGGYVARCLLDSTYVGADGAVDQDRAFAEPDTGFLPFVEITAPEKYRDEAATFGDYQVQPRFGLGCRWDGPGEWDADCLGAGIVAGSEPVARVVVTDAAGAEHEVPVADGWFAFAGTLVNRADGRSDPGALRVTSYAADGRVLAEVDQADCQARCR